MERLPVDEVAGEIVAALRSAGRLVLVAPPGAGKTTRVPQAILDGGLLADGQRVLVLEPRRLAARLAAQRIARERGGRIGEEVGYQVRFDDRTSARTRIAFLTEGILTRRLQSDPVLEDVGCVVLDEFHERSIHADLALAFLREIRETVRPDLALVVMSATLDVEPVRTFLRDAPVVESRGRVHPVEIEWLERRDERPLDERVASAVRRAVRENARGDLLVFLPGAPEIRRVRDALQGDLGPDIDVLPLYGELPAKEQDRAVEPGPRRKVVLSTNIAESSLTIEGVTVVIDAGVAKVLRHDPALGLDRLELTRISKKSAEQRAGRAGRTAPGRAYRLWTRQEEQHMPAAESPEVARIDLAAPVLEVVRWSREDPRRFGWFEAPPAAMLERAERLLVGIGALVLGPHRLTPDGERLVGLPLGPRIATMLIAAQRRGVLEEGALLAAIASERDILRRGPSGGGGTPRAGGRGRSDAVGASDLLVRLEAVEEIQRARFAPAVVDAYAADAGAVRNVLDVLARLLDVARRTLGDVPTGRRPRDAAEREEALGRAVLAGFPDRVGRRATPGDDRVLLATGGSARLARESVVKEAELLVAVEVEGGHREGPRIRVASQIERAWLEAETRGVEKVRRVRFNRDREAVEGLLETRYFELLLEERPLRDLDDADVARALEAAARQEIDRALPNTEAFDALLRRIAFVRRALPEVDLPEGDVRLALLPELVAGRRSFGDLRALDLAAEVEQRLPPEGRRALRAFAPERIEVPSGRNVELRYEPDGPPVLSVRLQEIFGMTETPRVAQGRVPVKVELLAPNLRPVQVTQDLRSFWVNTYPEVRNELRRRYPKHQWPEDPRDGDPRLTPGRRRR